jgi:hypothetical protein
MKLSNKFKDRIKILADIQGLKKFTSHTAFPKKLLMDVLHQNKVINQEKRNLNNCASGIIAFCW